MKNHKKIKNVHLAQQHFLRMQSSGRDVIKEKKFNIVFNRSSVSLLMLLFILVLPAENKAQNLGFGCLGLVGTFGGISIQRLNTDDLNYFVTEYNAFHQDSLSRRLENFGSVFGYRLGINFYRQNYSGLIVTVKGYYEKLNQKNTAFFDSDFGGRNNSMELSIKNFGLGFDLGAELGSFFKWKVLDASVVFNSTSLETILNKSNSTTDIAQYDAVDSPIGYSFGTGFIIDIIRGYVSLEGAAGYLFIEVGKMQTLSGKFLTKTETSAEVLQSIARSGGFNSVVQINLGVPL